MVAFSFNSPGTEAVGTLPGPCQGQPGVPYKAVILPAALCQGEWQWIVLCSLTVGYCRTGSVRGQGARRGSCGLRDGTSSSTHPCEIF